ncbi:MAG: ROK family protein, partial [Elusimicrobiota bacterium]|nr:ROK family protein [Elusimicrobiota bacterium]
MKNSYQNDIRTVLTLDAGGTNLAFNAIRAGKEILDGVTLPSNADNLEKCLANIVEGFKQVISQIKHTPVAISFAFPGPSDYKNGVIGDLPNFPAFNGKGGVALGPYLSEIFKVPVFINNDGDLFAYGEAMAGVLPELNAELTQRKINKTYRNLLGITLGTGCGGGVVRNGQLFLGDNGAAAEVWVLRNKKYNDCFAEEGISIRAVINKYKQLSGFKDALTPKDIFEIAEGVHSGYQEAAKKSFAELGEILGDLIANVITVIDGMVVIGGGLAAAHKYFMPYVIKELNSTLGKYDKSGVVPRLESKAFNLEDISERESFFKGSETLVTIPSTNTKVPYNVEKR